MIDDMDGFTRSCSICGDHIGMGFDHSECSKVKQEIFADQKRKVRPKTLPDKDIKYLGDCYSGR